jgi:hypothetical protein
MSVKFSIKIHDEREFEDLIQDLEASALEDRLERSGREAVQKVGQAVLDKVQSNLQNGRADWPALSAATVELRGAGQPLNDAGELLRSFGLTFDGDKAFVGIPEGATRTDGTPMDLVAAILEDGAALEVTPRMRGFLAARGVPLRPDTRVLIVPPRPFFDPALQEIAEALPGMLADLQAEVMPK